jgi:hypothetical protein
MRLKKKKGCCGGWAWVSTFKSAGFCGPMTCRWHRLKTSTISLLPPLHTDCFVGVSSIKF